MKPVSLVLAAAAAGLAFVLYMRGRRRPALAALAAAAGLAVWGSGVIDLPSLESILDELGGRLGGWTYLLVGVLAYLETAAFAGLVAPGELAVVFGGFVAGQGKIDPFLLVAIVWLCAVAGDSTGYVLGRRLGRGWALRHGARVKVTPARFEAVEGFFNRHGGKTIIVGRLIGFVRALAPFIAGASRMPYLRFLGASFVGAGAWSIAFVTLGYVFWRSLDTVIEVTKQGNLGLLAFVLLVGAAVAGYRVARRRDLRARLRIRFLRALGWPIRR
jgi:membrane protein DedA with SNARE-associated domain